MLGLAARNFSARKLRALSTALAVFFGVAMIAGTLMLTDSVNRTFEGLIGDVYDDVDVTIAPRVEVSGELGEAPTRGLDEALLDRVREIDGVGRADGDVGSDSIAIFGKDGERIGGASAPHIAFSAPEDLSDSPESSVARIDDGRGPEAAGEVAIDTRTAEKEGFEVGDLVRIAGAQGASEYAISGLLEFLGGDSFFGASLALVTLPEAQRLSGRQGRLDEITVEAAAGTPPEELAAALAVALPGGIEVRTGEQAADEEIADIEEAFGFLEVMLLVFAGIAVFVGGFLIFNTFSITVAQRVRQHAMLRTLGASARQVLAAVLLEAALVGLLASALGIVGGLGFVELIKALLRGAIGLDLPTSGVRIEAGTVAIAVGVGVGATVLSSLVPALRATRVAPLEALRESAGAQLGGTGTRRRGRTIAAATTIALGSAAVLAGLFAVEGIDEALSMLGIGLILLFVGIGMLGDRFVPRLASAVGWPIERLRGVTGRLARENSQRHPGRTATTAAALMIGVALVVFVGVLASSLRASIDDSLERQFAGDVAVSNVNGYSPIPAAITTALSELDGVAAASPYALIPARIDAGGEEETWISGLDPETIAEVTRFDWDQGSDATLAGLGRRGAIVESRWAETNGVAVGDEVTVTGPEGDRVTATVVGSVRDPSGLFVDTLALSRDTLHAELGAPEDDTVYASFVPAVDPERTRAAVDELLETRFPNAVARSQEELREDLAGEVDALLALIYALLGLSVLVSTFGIVNTLSMTILERIRELGMLRAIGTSRSQVRRMVRYESIITALLGALAGAAIGLGLGIASVEALKEEGLVLAISVSLLIGVLAAAIAIGVVAAIHPARRASRLDVIEALTYE